MNPNLFQSIEQCLRSNNALQDPPSPVIQPGSLVRFVHSYAKPGHDQVPLVLVTAPLPYIDKRTGQKYMRGVNLNYLTFPTIKALLQQFAENQSFSYAQNLKGQKYIVSAFRQYKYPGISGIQKLNSPFLLNVLACARSVDPNEIEAIRKVVRDQIRGLSSQLAMPTGEMPVGTNPQQQSSAGLGKQ